MINKLREQLGIRKPTRLYIIKILPLVFFLTFFLLRVSLGLADPTSPPPLP